MRFIKEQAKYQGRRGLCPPEKKGKVWVDPNQSIKQVVEEDMDSWRRNRDGA